MKRTPEQRFWGKVDKNGPIPSHCPELGPCWLWTAGLHDEGYGRFYFAPTDDGRIVPSYAHRVAYELLVGPIPGGLTLDHRCRNRACVNPDHLEPVTRAVNTLRGVGPSMTAHRLNQCAKGHERTPENTYVSPGGQRHCRICRQEYHRERRARRLKGNEA